jgi:2-phospho-L-lactate guanylyltransferase
MPVVHAAVLVPVKSFAVAKGRLSPLLTPDQRKRLSQWMAERVLAAAGELATYVACDDDEVAEWARARGAQVMWRPATGLNAAVTDSVSELRDMGVEYVVVAHSDLPGASDLASLARADHIVLVPDHRLDGTNVVGVPTDVSFDFSYGGGSFTRHLQQAMASSHAVTVRHDAVLSLDVDRPADLAHPLLADRLPTWLPTIPANLR